MESPPAAPRGGASGRRGSGRGRGRPGSKRTTPGGGSPSDRSTVKAAVDGLVGTTMELEIGSVAAGGGCVARAADGRVVFVRHTLPGERVVAVVTSVTTKFLRADAMEILEPSVDRVVPPCPHAGPGRCGGCDWQHAALPAQRSWKATLVEEQLRRLAGVDRRVTVEAVEGSPDGLGWRTRVQFAVDRSGRVGFHRHRSHVVEPIDSCPLATAAVTGVGVSSLRWKGARHVEVTASPDGGRPVVSVETGRSRLDGPPKVDAGLVVNGARVAKPDRVAFRVEGTRFEVGPGVFWQVHPAAGAVLTRCVLDGLSPEAGEEVADLYAGAGLFTVPLARAVGRRGSVVAVERNGRACADAVRNADGLHQVRIVRADVTPGVVAEELAATDLVVLDPSREGAGAAVMEALDGLRPSLRRMVYVACDPASFARDLRVMLDRGWVLGSLRAFDLFPMTEHVELVAVLTPSGPVAAAAARPPG